MKIIFVKAFVIFPSAALKGREPVVRRTLAVLALALAPEIVIVIGVVNALFSTIGWTTSSITVRDGAITGVPEGSSSI